VKWSKPIQAMVSEETQTKLKLLSKQAGTTVSGLCREILDNHVEEKPLSKIC
jgi:predicted DNA-binding protein